MGLNRKRKIYWDPYERVSKVFIMFQTLSFMTNELVFVEYVYVYV